MVENNFGLKLNRPQINLRCSKELCIIENKKLNHLSVFRAHKVGKESVEAQEFLKVCIIYKKRVLTVVFVEKTRTYSIKIAE